MSRTEPIEINWSDYFRYRAELRGYDLSEIEAIVRFSDERYYDTETFHPVVIGKYDKRLLIIPYEINYNIVTPVTVHAITRQQIRFRLKTGRLIYEETGNEIFS